MKLDFYASEPHFLDHLAPVWRALPRELRGTLYTPLATRAQQLSIQAATQPPIFENRLMLVASLGDLKRALRYGRRPILMEHGAGQSYSNSHASYAGGRSTERWKAVAFLVPNQWAADRNTKANPKVVVRVVGCPKLDALPPAPSNEQPIIAVSFHWPCMVAPESKWAFPHYSKAVVELARHYQVLGHAHPRAIDQLAPFYRAHGIEVVAEFSEVLQRANLYACDNSSTIFEFAATGRPVLLLNAPWYRRRINHGLRFWDCATVGVQCNHAEGLVAMAAEALADSPAQQAERQRIVDLVYPYRGQATQRAVEVLRELL